MKREIFASGEERPKPSEFKEDEIEIIIDKDERYPDFTFVTTTEIPMSETYTSTRPPIIRAKITREQMEWLLKIEAEYSKGQNFLAKLANWEE